MAEVGVRDRLPLHDGPDSDACRAPCLTVREAAHRRDDVTVDGPPVRGGVAAPRQPVDGGLVLGDEVVDPSHRVRWRPEVLIESSQTACPWRVVGKRLHERW